MNAALLLLSIGAAVGLLSAWQADTLLELASAVVVSVLLFVVIACLTVVEIIFHFSRNAGVAEFASRQCEDIGFEAGKLFRLAIQSDDYERLAENTDTLRNLLNAAKRTELPYDDELD